MKHHSAFSVLFFHLLFAPIHTQGAGGLRVLGQAGGHSLSCPSPTPIPQTLTHCTTTLPLHAALALLGWGHLVLLSRTPKTHSPTSAWPHQHPFCGSSCGGFAPCASAEPHTLRAELEEEEEEAFASSLHMALAHPSLPWVCSAPSAFASWPPQWGWGAAQHFSNPCPSPQAPQPIFVSPTA